MVFVLQTANVTADARNCVYPNRVEITSGDELKETVRFDHVCGEFKKNYRNINNFLKSNVIVMDCDNDHSEDPEDWITFQKLEELFEEIDYAAAPSRNHMKEKEGKAARPKFHVYFPIEETGDAEYYVAVKRAIQKAFPFFDDNALDACLIWWPMKCIRNRGQRKGQWKQSWKGSVLCRNRQESWWW